MKKDPAVSFQSKEINLQKRDFLSQFLKSLMHSARIKVLLLFILPVFGFSQNVKIEKSDKYLKDQITSAARNTDVSKIKSLIKDLHPSVYLTGGRINSYGESPISLFTDIESIGLLKTVKIDVSTIEIVTITIKSKDELQSFISLSDFSRFASLKVLHLNVQFECTSEMLEPMIKGDKPTFVLLYSVERPS